MLMNSRVNSWLPVLKRRFHRDSRHCYNRPSGAKISRFLVLLFALSLPGCWTSSGPEVVVYTAQDEEFAKPIFEDFTKATGIAVLPKFDTESTKTAGLANDIVDEAAPAAMRCLLE